MRIAYWKVEPEWKGETVAILGGGPSLTPQDVALLKEARDRSLVTGHWSPRVIAINNAYWLAPWADILYFCDEVWWLWHHGGTEIRQHGPIAKPVVHKGDPRYKAFPGRKVALSNACTYFREPDVRVLQNYGRDDLGLCELTDGVYCGRSSGYQAINLAAHLGVARVLLLGYDMRTIDGRTHWHMAHGRPTAPDDLTTVMLPAFRSLVEPCRARGIEVVNCTPGSAITCFRSAALAEALRESGRAGEREGGRCAAGA